MEGVGTAVVSHGNSSPILKTAKHNLNFVALLVESFIIFGGVLPISFGRNTGGYASTEQYLTKPVCIIASICQQFLSLWHGSQQLFCPLIIAYLAFCEGKSKRLSFSVAKRMELGIQSTSCASDTAGKSPFLSRLAAVRCALRCVASIITFPSLPAVFESSRKMLLNMPMRLQRIKRLYKVL